MEHDDNQLGLSLRERCQVLGIATGFLFVLGLLAWLATSYSVPAEILDRIPEFFQAGKIRSALGMCLTLVFYVVGIPFGLILSLLCIFHGALGKRTRLTNWILRQLNHQEIRRRHEQTLESLVADGELHPTDKVLHSHLPPAAGWAIFLMALVVPLAVLVWIAARQ